MNQGKLEMVKQEMARVNIYILGISELKWAGMGEFNSDDLYIYYCGQESLRRNGVVIVISKRVRNAVLGCNLKNNRMVSARFQGKPFNITVIQVYAATSNAEEADTEGSMKTYKNFENDRMISVHFQGKPFNLTVIQVYAPTSNTEEAEVEWFFEDLQDILELTHKQDVLLIIGNWNAKVGSQEIPGVTGKFILGL